jgi:hypothetical protein
MMSMVWVDPFRPAAMVFSALATSLTLHGPWNAHIWTALGVFSVMFTSVGMINLSFDGDGAMPGAPARGAVAICKNSRREIDGFLLATL